MFHPLLELDCEFGNVCTKWRNCKNTGCVGREKIPAMFFSSLWPFFFFFSIKKTVLLFVFMSCISRLFLAKQKGSAASDDLILQNSVQWKDGHNFTRARGAEHPPAGGEEVKIWSPRLCSEPRIHQSLGQLQWATALQPFSKAGAHLSSVYL